MTVHLPEGHYLTTFHHTLAGSTRPGICQMGMEYVGTNFAVDAQAVAVAWSTEIVGSMNSVWTYVLCQFRQQEGTIIEFQLATVGGKSGAASPPQVSYLIHKRSQKAGRKGKGRLYLPGASDTEVTDSGHVQASMVNELQNAFNDFRFACSAAHFQLEIIHNDGVTFPTSITALDVDTMVATQRRRLRK